MYIVPINGKSETRNIVHGKAYILQLLNMARSSCLVLATAPLINH